MTHLLFAGHNYYPRGGIADLAARGTIDELKQYFQDNAEEIARGYIDNWGQIVDPATMQCVLWGEVGAGETLRAPGVAVWRDTPFLD